MFDALCRSAMLAQCLEKRCCVAGAFLVMPTVNQEKYYNKKGQLSLALVICAESQDSSEASSVSWAISETRAFC